MDGVPANDNDDSGTTYIYNALQSQVLLLTTKQ